MRKEVLLFAVAALLAAGAQAQTNWGLKAGVTMPTIHFGSKSDGLKSKMNTNFYVTGFADFALSESFSIQPGLSYQGKGGKFEITDEDGKIESKINLSYLEIPVNAIYYIPAGAGKFLIGAGPYAAYGLSGKVKIGKESEKVEWGNKGKDLKHFDFGINTMIGYKLAGGFLINVGYGIGLMDINSEMEGGDSNPSAKNRVLSAGIGFQF